MAGTLKSFGPLALTNTYATDIHNQPSALIYSVLKKIKVTNKTGAPVTFRLFLGATTGVAAGTELEYDKSVPANDSREFYYNTKFLSTQFITGGASAATSLTILIETEQYVV